MSSLTDDSSWCLYMPYVNYLCQAGYVLRGIRLWITKTTDRIFMNILPQMYVTEIYAWTRRSPLDVDNLDHVTLQLGLQLPWQRSVLSECLFIYNCIFFWHCQEGNLQVGVRFACRGRVHGASGSSGRGSSASRPLPSHRKPPQTTVRERCERPNQTISFPMRT